MSRTRQTERVDFLDGVAHSWREMPLLPDETVHSAAMEAFGKAILRESDPWRQARLLAFVRKQRQCAALREVAAELLAREGGARPEERACYWAALEILTEPSALPPATGPLWIEPVSDVCFVRIPAGAFRMGSVVPIVRIRLRQFWNEDVPVHEVAITEEYWLGRHTVTNGEYRRYLTADREAKEPESWKDPQFNLSGQPVVGVSWREAEEGYCGWLRERTSLRFHLPTEAEWENGCRAGSTTEYCYGDDPTRLGEYAWHDEAAGEGSTHVVGTKRCNGWGLNDMHGNVWEWCSDEMGGGRVYRGGSWRYDSQYCRSAHREWFWPDRRDDDRGFRPALTPSIR